MRKRFIKCSFISCWQMNNQMLKVMQKLIFDYLAVKSHDRRSKLKFYECILCICCIWPKYVVHTHSWTGKIDVAKDEGKWAFNDVKTLCLFWDIYWNIRRNRERETKKKKKGKLLQQMENWGTNWQNKIIYTMPLSLSSNFHF